MQPAARPRGDEGFAREESPQWQCVLQWPMSGQDKLGWRTLWLASRGGREAVVATATLLAAYQGVTSDAGLQRIKNLATAGLIEAKRLEQGRYEVRVFDPREVALARRIEWDGQRELFGKHDDLSATDDDPSRSSPAEPASVLSFAQRALPEAADAGPPRADQRGATEEPPEVPRRGTADPRSAPSPSRKPLQESSPSHLHPSGAQGEGGRGEEEGRAQRGTSGGTSAGRSPGPVRVGDLLRGTGGAAESPAAAFARRKEAWAVRIHAGVQDASLWADIPDQVAAGVAEGRIKEEEVDGLLRALDRQRRAGKLRSAAAYFNIAAIKLLKRHGVYRQPKPKRGQA